MRIPFNKPHLTGKEAHYMYQAVAEGKLSGNGAFTKKCQQFFEERYGFKKCLLTTSCTDALEMAAILCDIQPGDEVIVPSYTFVSSALAFVRAGAKIVFADSMKDNPNIDAEKIESLITPRTKVIVPVHYAGVACDMDRIMEIANRHNLIVVEDAAQAIDSYYTPPTNSPRNGGERDAFKTADPLIYELLKEKAQHLRNNPTEVEEALWKYLRDEQLGTKFRRQHIINDSIADFVSLETKLIIEVDGGYHNNPEQREADDMRDKLLKSYGFTTLRVTNQEVLCDTENTVARIKFAVETQRKLKALAPYGERVGLGAIGHLSAFSFHETKNIIAGEGGMLCINDERFIRRAEIIWEKGTNRAEFFRGEVNKYGWVDTGSSFLPSEVIAAFLWAQLEHLDEIQARRKHLWDLYYTNLSPISSLMGKSEGASLPLTAEQGGGFLPVIPSYATNNAHMFYLVCDNLEERTALIEHLKDNGILAVFHYLSLHSSPYYTDKHDGRALPECDRYADCLVRLPMYYDLKDEEVLEICRLIKEFVTE